MLTKLVVILVSVLILVTSIASVNSGFKVPTAQLLVPVPGPVHKEERNTNTIWRYRKSQRPVKKYAPVFHKSADLKTRKTSLEPLKKEGIPQISSNSVPALLSKTTIKVPSYKHQQFLIQANPWKPITESSIQWLQGDSSSWKPIKKPPMQMQQHRVPYQSDLISWEPSMQMQETRFPSQSDYYFASSSNNPSTSSNTMAIAMAHKECKAMSSLIGDLGIISLLLSFLGLIFGMYSLQLSSYWNIFGSGLSVVFVGFPSLVVNLLHLFGIHLDEGTPFETILIIKSILDSLNNMFSIVPGSLFSDFLGLISIILSKISLAIGIVTTYPKLLEIILANNSMLKEFVEMIYGC